MSELSHVCVQLRFQIRIYICGHMSSFMRMLNSSLLVNEKLRGPVVRNAGGVKMNTKNVLQWKHALWLLFNIQSSD